MEKIKIIDKYIAKQLIEAFLIGMVIFTSIMFASDTFLTLVKQITTYGIPFKVAIMIVILKLPSILVLTIPMGVLLSTIMTINKLSLNSEITVMRACGISISRMAKSALIFGIVAALGAFFINEAIVPVANSQAKTLTIWALGQKNIPEGKRNFSMKELKPDGSLKRLFYIDKNENKTLKGLTILDMSKKGTVQIIQSKYGVADPKYWGFNQGGMYTISDSGKVLNTTIFDNLKLYNSTGLIDSFNRTQASEMNILNLTKYLYQNKNNKNIRFSDLVIQLNEKLSIPSMAFIFALIGIPLAITPPRPRFNRGLLFSIFVIFCYYLFRAISISMGQAETITPFIAAWLPDLIIGSVGYYLFYKKACLI